MLRFDGGSSYEAVTVLESKGNSVVVKKGFRRPGEDAADGIVLEDSEADY